MIYCIIGLLLSAVLAIFIWRKHAYEEIYSGNLSNVKSPLLIFDFDGTICPSYDLFVATVNSLSDEYGFSKIVAQEKENLKFMTAKAVIKKLGISSLKLPFLIKKLRKKAQKQLLELDLVPGIREILKELKSKDISLGILTSNSEDNVRLYLQKHNIHFFDFIYSGNSIFSKAQHLKTILKGSGLHPKRDKIFFIGDEIRDIEAAQKAQVIGVGVTWGYNSLTVLNLANPDYLCEEPGKLKSMIESTLLKD